VAITPDGKDFYFCVYTPGYSHSAILVSRLGKDGWTRPEVAPFARDLRWKTGEPHVSPDGKRFYFISNRPGDPKAEKPVPFGIWVMDRAGEGWSEARRLGPEINGKGSAYFPSLTKDGTLYFTREGEGGNAICRAKPAPGGGFQEPEKLPAQVNGGRDRYNAWVDPEERFIIVPTFGAADGAGGTDYCIAFRNEKEAWSEPLNMGPIVNTKSNEEYSACVTPDGKWLFFMSVRAPLPQPSAGEPLSYARLKEFNRILESRHPAVYWVDAGFIGELRQKAVFK
jgi:hypothetical protein